MSINISKLLENKGDLNSRNKDDNTALYIAVKNSNIDIINKLLENKADINIKNGGYNEKYNTALHIAVKNCNENIINILLQNKADIEATNNNNTTPLYIAVENGNENIVNMLLQNKADINKTSVDGSVLHFAVKNGNINMINKLLENKVDINIKDNDYYEKQTVLHIAIKNNNKDIVNILLKNKANIDEKNAYNYTPLYIASQKNNKDIVTILLKNNANMEIGDTGGYTPLHIVSKENNKDIIKILLENKANMENKDNNGMTPLFNTIYKNNIINFNTLLEKKANIEAKDNNGNTPLHIAINNSLPITIKLLENNADIKAKNNNNDTILDIIKQSIDNNDTKLDIIKSINNFQNIKTLLEYNNDIIIKEIKEQQSISLEQALFDMKIRKENKMLYMINDQNHPIIIKKINKWIDIQCNQINKTIAKIIRSKTVYVSWKNFYDKLKEVFDRLYKMVKDKSYCIISKKVMSKIDVNKKSNYWILQLLLDYYISKGYTNLPKELVMCSKKEYDTDYDYYVILDDCVYSGGQVNEIIENLDYDKDKIIVATPYVSEYALNRLYDSRKSYDSTIKNWIYEKIMTYWWKNLTVPIGKYDYYLNDDYDRNMFLNILVNVFPNSDDNTYNDNNFMYYFDHKIADYASSFPAIYQTGLISSNNNKKEIDIETYDDNRKSSKEICNKRKYYPFIDNCNYSTPILDDINEDNQKHNHKNLCIEPWYKKEFVNKYKNNVLLLDIDKPNINLKNILQLSWDNLIKVYIVSNKDKKTLIDILDKFYKDNNILYFKIDKNNIFYSYKDQINDEKMKVKYLEYIQKKNNLNKEDIIYCSDKLDEARIAGFTQLIDNNYINEFLEKKVQEHQNKLKYLKYKLKYIKLQKSLK